MNETARKKKWIANEELILTKLEEERSLEQLFYANNKVWIKGNIAKEFCYSHKANETELYTSELVVRRRSGSVDLIPIMVAKEQLPLKQGEIVEISGRFCSSNEKSEEGKAKLILRVHAKSIQKESVAQSNDMPTNNAIYLAGYLCKKKELRKTPSGIDIIDFILAVNRSEVDSSDKETDYIPCIAWDSKAIWINNLKIGEKIELYGRIQSREYFKRFSPNSEGGETRIAYEISTTDFHKCNG